MDSYVSLKPSRISNLENLLKRLFFSVTSCHMDPHSQDVEVLRQQLKNHTGQFSLQNHPHPSNITRSHAYKSGAPQLNINNFNRILKIDPEGRRIVVEPRVTMEQLAEAALEKGMMVPVIPEFRGITVGGAIMGAGLESASHRYGLFSDNCLAYEILLGDGTVIRSTPDEHADLFYGIVGSYGSLGVLLSIELQLIPAQTWVKLKYRKFSSIADTVKYFERNQGSLSGPDFTEGLVFTPDHIKVIEGNFLENIETVPNTLSQKYPWSDWFYTHAKQLPDQYEEKIPLLEYLFRHDRGAFWIGAYGTHWAAIPRYLLESRFKLPSLAKLLPTFRPENFKGIQDPGPLFRLIWGWAMTSHRLYKWLHSQSEDWVANQFIIQDFCIPAENVVPFVEKLSQDVSIFPLWLCPSPTTKKPQILSPHFLPTTSSFIINVGIYGISPSTRPSAELVKQLENWTKDAKGRKVLYSYSYYTPEEFWSIYPQQEYDRLRQAYHADRWMKLDQKVLPH
jgi:delta24-sterol reductase